MVGVVGIVNGSDALVVSCAELAGVLMPIVKQHDEEREDWLKSGSWGPEGHERSRGWSSSKDVWAVHSMKEGPLGGVGYVAAVCGIPARQVWGVLKGDRKWVTLGVADTWLTALGLQHLLADGTVRVVPNPRWTAEHWSNYMTERGCSGEFYS